jgi:hypothetical protein
MPAKNGTASDKGVYNGKSASELDLKFFGAVLGNMRNKPDVNWDNVKQVMGLKECVFVTV